MTLRPLLAAALASAALPALAAPVAVPPLRFTQRTLTNGLRVYAMPDTAGATVSVQVWYDVGSKNDPRGRSGFAHLFEHLMFKATRNMPNEMLDRLTEDVGGANNASTNDDYTEYHETAPANHLERLIWAEGERMGSLVVDQPVFASEREVVKEELRTDQARPYGDLFYHALSEANYRVHPYARPTIGSIADLDAATIDDVRAFHALYYRPDNAVMVVSGNFDPAQLNGWIDKYLGPIARPGWAIPRVGVKEPARVAPARFLMTAPNTPLPAAVVSWLIPPTTDPDHPVLNVIDAILSGGESSRMYQHLVYRDQIASQAEISADIKKDTGVLAAIAIMAGGHGAAEGEAALRREVADLRDHPVDAAELERVKNQVITSALKQRETAEGRASLVAEGVIVDGDPRASDKRLAQIQAVTAADVQRVARRWLTDAQAVSIHYMAPDAVGSDKGAPVAIAPGVVTQTIQAPAGVRNVTAAAPEARQAPPAPGAAVTPVLPVPAERRLANGMRLVVLERHALPIVTAYLVGPRGSASDPAGRAGLAEIAADLMTKGTATMTAPQVVSAVESLGGGIGGDATRDGSTLELTVKADELEPAMRVFADVALHPAFSQAELDRSRAQALDDLSVAYKTPGALAGMVMARAIYGDGPYGTPASGTPASLKAISRADVAGAYGRSWRPDTATLVMAGDITADEAQALANRLFGAWRAPAGARVAAPVERATPRPRTIVVDLPGSPQAAVVIGRQTIRRSDPDYYSLLVANTALGGGFSARLNQEVRVKRGLSYGASSRFAAGRLPGSLTAAAQTKNASAPEVIAVTEGEMAKLGQAVLPADELAARKAALIGGFGSGIETTDGLASVAAGLVVQGVAVDEIDRYARLVQAVDAAAVKAVSVKYLDPAPASTVVVGDAGQFLAGMKAKGLTPEVIPAAALKLDQPGLR